MDAAKLTALRDQIEEAAAGPTLRPDDAALTCEHRSRESVGTQECPSCKGRVRLKTFHCAQRAGAEVTLQDCRRCQAFSIEPRSRPILVAVGWCGADPARLPVLRRALLSVRAAGPDTLPLLVVTGPADGVRSLPEASGIPIREIGSPLNQQQGESAIGCAALDFAELLGIEWTVKVAGDTFHAAPGWGRALIALAQREGASLVATEHHFPERVNTQVFAVRTAFMARTWPRLWDPLLSKQGIEPSWGQKIKAAGLIAQWHAPKAVKITEGPCENFSPVDPAIAYQHSHRADVAATWHLAAPVQMRREPSLSIVIPSRNETDLLNTVADVVKSSAGHAPPEIIIADDASDPPVVIPPMDGASIRVLRNPMSIGVDPGRNAAAAGATGDVIGILDAHMRVQTQAYADAPPQPIPGGLQTLAARAVELNAIVVGRCAHIEIVKPLHDYPLCGGSFVKITKPEHVLGMGWNHFDQNTDGLHRINGLLGASYFFPRAIWERLQGFVGCCQCWGFSEEGMALKACALNIPIWYCGEVTVSHQFRTTGPHPFTVDGFHKWINCGKVLSVIFEPQTFNDFWKARVKSLPAWAGQWGPRHELELASHAVQAEGARFRPRKVKSDAEIILELFGLKL